MTDWQELEKKYFMRTFSRVPLTLVRGEGAKVWDDKGREYLDFVAGWAVNCLGHCHPVLVKAVSEQAATLIQVSNQYYTIPQLQLAGLLIENSCLDRIFISNSGAEANEGAVKLARRYGQRCLNGAYEVITTLGSFHGRTLGMVAATGQAKHQQPYIPLPTGFVNVEYDNVEAIKAATTEKTCAVMVEPIQGEGGVNIPHPDYLKKVQEWSNSRGILFILDEIQTGIGRIGSLFGYQQYGVEPDVMTLAKGLASGVPIGAFLSKEKASVFEPGEHGSTFGGNPLACAAAYATIKYILEEDVCSNVQQVGEYLRGSLEKLREKHDCITDIRGRGLLVAIEFNSEIGQALLESCLEQGLLVNRVRPSALRLMPPLTIGKAEVDQAAGILDTAISSISK